MLVPHAMSNDGQGACLFLVGDSSEFVPSVLLNAPITEPAAIAKAFITAATDPNGACGLQPITVAITKTASTTAALAPGDAVDYTVTVTNTSAALPAANVLVSDPVPTGIDPASVSWTCTSTATPSACPAPGGTGALSQTIASLPAGKSVTYAISAEAAASVPATVTNIATASGLDLFCDDGGPQPCTAKVSNPLAEADMQGSASTATATIGTPVTVNTACTNAGPNPAINATCAVTGAPAGATTVCSPPAPVASLAVNASITCATTFTPRTRAQITLTATAGSDTPDPDRANDAAHATITPTGTVAAAASSIPTLSEMALALLALLLTGGAAARLRRKG